MNPDVQVLIDAGLRPLHVSSLIDVNRVSVSYWFSGKVNPHRWIADRVHELAQAVRQAMADGKLPIRDDKMNRDEVSHRTYAVTQLYYLQRQPQEVAAD